MVRLPSKTLRECAHSGTAASCHKPTYAVQQNLLVAFECSLRRIGRIGSHHFLRSIHNSRQPDREGRAVARLTFDHDVSTHHLAEPSADHETEAGAAVLARRGACEEIPLKTGTTPNRSVYKPESDQEPCSISSQAPWRTMPDWSSSGSIESSTGSVIAVNDDPTTRRSCAYANPGRSRPVGWWLC
jgi:hypothetical protein